MVNFKMPEDVYEAVMAMRSPVPYRVLMYLVAHAYDAPSTRREMAATVGASSRAVGKALKRLREAGVIMDTHREVIHRFDLSLEIPRPDVTEPEQAKAVDALTQQIELLKTRVTDTEGQLDDILCDSQYDVDAAYARGVETGRAEALAMLQCGPPSGTVPGDDGVSSGAPSSMAAGDVQDNDSDEAPGEQGTHTSNCQRRPEFVFCLAV